MKRIVLTFCIMMLSACAANRPVPGEAPPSAVPIAVEKDRAAAEQASPNGGLLPAWSPDGAMIAFTSSTRNTPADLWVMKADGTGARRLTSRGVQYFRWTPDSKSIMFVARRKGYEEVMTIGVDGSGEKRFPGLPPNASVPLYSPDGTLFAFTAIDQKKAGNLWVGTADGARVEQVTEKIGVRNIFWAKDSRKVYFETGKTYGMGIWAIDLATMESKDILNKYIGSPIYSSKADLIAFPYPPKPGQFEVHTMKPDGTDAREYKAPRLAGRYLEWDAEDKGFYYLGQDLEEVKPDEKKKEDSDKEKMKGAPPHETTDKGGFNRVGVTSLWHLDLLTGTEKRVSPANLHVSDFTLSPDGRKVVLAALLEQSHAQEVFSLDVASGEMTRLTVARSAAWMPVPSPDAAKIAFFTNDKGFETLKVAAFGGEELASYPGFALEGGTKVFWLPESDGLLVFAARGLSAFNEKGPIDFPDSEELRTYLSADASIQADKVLLSAIPRYGEMPGLYMLQGTGGKLALTDLRFPPPSEDAPERYFQPRWSFDGERVAFTDGIDVWTMKGDGTARTRITRYAERNEEGKQRPAVASFPVWSVKRDILCYTLTVYEDKAVRRQLWVVNADGTGQKMLYSEELDSQFQVFQPEYTNQPFFDATDERIIFTLAENGIPNIHAVALKDGKIRQLTETGAIFPALLPEEGIIVFTSLEGNNETIWLMNSDGSEKRPFVFKAAPAPAPAEKAAPAAAEPAKNVENPAPAR